ncbi:hypothetical protein vseg_001539 [Gypsophila vaccaria]
MSLICSSLNTTTTTTTTNNSTYFRGKLTSSSSSSSSSSALSLPSSFYFVNYHPQQRSMWALSAGAPESYGPDLLRKPSIAPPPPAESLDGPQVGVLGKPDDGRGEDRWLDWEDQILEDTVPLVGFVRMILHSGKYQSGDRLSPEHETTILERLLPFHPEFEKKIGCGIDYITIGYHPQFEESRCLFIVRKDGELEDFSYWKCIKGFIRKNYPLYADSFILKHFRRRRRYD